MLWDVPQTAPPLLLLLLRSPGARYSGVPHSVYVRSVTTFAKPKSQT